MEQRDYLMREVSRIGLVLSAIVGYLLGLKRGGDSTCGIEYVSQTLKSELNFDLELISSIEQDKLIDFLLIDKGFNENDLDKFLEVLFIIADDMSEDNPQRDHFYKMCLTINEHVEKTQKIVSFERYMKINQIKIKRYV